MGALIQLKPKAKTVDAIKRPLLVFSKKDDKQSRLIQARLRELKEIEETIEELSSRREDIRESIKSMVLNVGINVKPDSPNDKFLLIPEEGIKIHHYNMGRRSYNQDAIFAWAVKNGVSSEVFPPTFNTANFRSYLKDMSSSLQAKLAPDAGVYALKISKLSSKACRSCGTTVKKRNKFCSECGARM